MISNILLKPKENEIVIVDDNISKEKLELLKEHLKVVEE